MQSVIIALIIASNVIKFSHSQFINFTTMLALVTTLYQAMLLEINYLVPILYFCELNANNHTI